MRHIRLFVRYLFYTQTAPLLQVTGVVGRAETLSSLFFLGALWAYAGATSRLVRGPRGARVATDWRLMLTAMLLATTAMLCKEQGITIIAICAVYELFVVQKVGGCSSSLAALGGAHADGES